MQAECVVNVYENYATLRISPHDQPLAFPHERLHMRLGTCYGYHFALGSMRASSHVKWPLPYSGCSFISPQGRISKASSRKIGIEDLAS